ncbi:hypothetical protein NPIL_58171, partial [Nephila pilipes]
RLRRRRQAAQVEQAAQAEVELSCFAGCAGGGRVELFFSCYSFGFGFQGAGGAGCAGSGRVELFSFCYSFGFGFQGAGGAGCAGSGRVELFSFYF